VTLNFQLKRPQGQITSLTAAGVIAMTATIMPTPLGADNVIAANTLGYDVLKYCATAMINNDGSEILAFHTT
jgi:C4-dicarboxylate transporter